MGRHKERPMIPSPNQIIGPDHGGIGSMIEYKLYRIEDDGTTTEVSKHEFVADGVAAGVEMVENVDLDFAYTLRSG